MIIEGNTTGPILLLHGGAGNAPSEHFLSSDKFDSLDRICAKTWSLLHSGTMAIESVKSCVQELEDDPLFNAGRGSTLCSDGLVRVSASIMDSQQECFSGVSCATHLQNPIVLAAALQSREDRVLGPTGAQLLARELAVPPQDPVTDTQAARWAEYRFEASSGTVGAVARDSSGTLAAATSTGGRGFTFPDRLSDVSTVAGNYSSRFACISCTGIGEHIVDSALAARLETRVRDGCTFHEASRRCLSEAQDRQRSFGWIGMDWQGNWGIYYTTSGMSAAARLSEHSNPLVLNRDLFAAEMPS